MTSVKDRLGHIGEYKIDFSKDKKIGWKSKTNFDKDLLKTINFYRTIKVHIMKAISLWRSTGSRMRPSTLGINKHLIPVYNKLYDLLLIKCSDVMQI